jgi:S-adenosylmethionine-dependent methyltransferase
MLNKDLKKIKKYYDDNPQKEWIRLDKYPFEFPVTFSFLEKYIKPNSKILDIGGGPGKYAFPLKKMGHEVILIDLSAGNIKLAKRKEKELGFKLDGCYVMEATDLSYFNNSSFDVILNFGPLYHLQKLEDRKKIVNESLRVLKTGGVGAFAFLSIYGPVYDLIKKDPSLINERYENIKNIMLNKMHTESEGEPGFTDIFLIDPMEIKEFFNSFNIECITIFGAEGLTSQSEWIIKKAGNKILKKWIDFAIETAETIGALNCSEHIIYIGRKK